MFDDIEETLGRELRDVAGDLHVPPLPPLPQEPPGAHRHWQPLLVAAAVLVVVVGTVALVSTTRDDQEPSPAPPSPTRSGSAERIATTPPTVPYVLDQRLYVDGEQVPGDWWSVRSGEAAWLALRTDNTWWWGWGPQAHEIEGRFDVPPVLSPNGAYVGEIREEDGEGRLTGFDTRPSGEGLGGVPIDLGDHQDGSTVTVRAVTDDGRVIAQGTHTSFMWLPLVDNSTVDLSVTAPGQLILGNTPAGLVVTDSSGGVLDGTMGEPYLAEISDAGELTRIGPVPTHDDLAIAPGGRWLLRTPAGTTGGDITSILTLEVQALDGPGQATLTAPEGWAFQVRAWAWEDAEHLVSPVVRADGSGSERMVRCSAPTPRCVLIDAG
jgi:hypothetical protein